MVSKASFVLEQRLIDVKIDPKGFTPLDTAAKFGNKRCALQLIDKMEEYYKGELSLGRSVVEFQCKWERKMITTPSLKSALIDFKSAWAGVNQLSDILPDFLVECTWLYDWLSWSYDPLVG